MVKTMHSFRSQVRLPGIEVFLNLLDPSSTKGTGDMQAVRSHRSDGDREVPQVHVTCEPSGPTGQMVPQVHMTCKSSGPTGQIEMENGPTGTHDT
jgi:hypothetical protein